MKWSELSKEPKILGRDVWGDVKTDGTLNSI